MCDCIKNVNSELASKGVNTKVETFLIGRQVALLRTVKANEKKREKPAILAATFCPFCGTEYPADAGKEG